MLSAYGARHGVGDAELSRRTGISRQSLYLWRTKGLRAVPPPELVGALARVMAVPYREVLNAALAETGYCESTVPDVTVYNLVVAQISTSAIVTNTLHQGWGEVEAAVLERFWDHTDHTRSAAQMLMTQLHNAHHAVEDAGVYVGGDFPPLSFRVQRWDLSVAAPSCAHQSGTSGQVGEAHADDHVSQAIWPDHDRIGEQAAPARSLSRGG
ncbi:helix-turn-helix domain-containing protein [Jongsikchunia kroppenstedtii]|uniref:helix-turn-helix domain-containing protein n=1 Tax=Jongsikchunia kroppenstedtii TaxID=1121721 RepID=UPI0012DD77A1|nr:helix-turn-helix transcriptional regulator [Jongsikchunia kroppenstedtii]